MLQATSIYTSEKGERWKEGKMQEIMIDIAETSIKKIASDLFDKLKNNIK